MRKMRPRRPRESRARAIARMYLREKMILKPPINMYQLIKEYGKIIWTEDIDTGFTVYHEIKNKYFIFINPKAIRGRKNWTLCHELAHIVLGHFIDYEMNNLNFREEKILDREANVFVREFLMPEEWVLNHYQPPLTISQLGRLKNKFDVSWDALFRRLGELHICQYKETIKLFKCSPGTYIAELGGENYCTEMSGGVFKMSIPFDFPEIDENMRFTRCPKCGNKIFSNFAKYCKKCGNYLFNDCTNENDDNFNHNWCGKPNIPDALYCEYCGSITLIGQLVHKLENGDKEEDASQNISFENDDIPF